MVRISMIVVASLDGVIAVNGEKPREMRIGLNPFYRLTRGHFVVVGRKTFETMLKRRRGRPLKDRTVVVLTRNPSYHPSGCLVTRTFDGAIDLAETRGETEIFVLGGAEVFGQAISRAQRVYLTLLRTFLGNGTRLLLLPSDAWRFSPGSLDRTDYTTKILERKF